MKSRLDRSRFFVDIGTQVFDVVLDNLYLLVEGRRSAVTIGTLGDQSLVELQWLSTRSEDNSFGGRRVTHPTYCREP